MFTTDLSAGYVISPYCFPRDPLQERVGDSRISFMLLNVCTNGSRHNNEMMRPDNNFTFAIFACNSYFTHGLRQGASCLCLWIPRMECVNWQVDTKVNKKSSLVLSHELFGDGVTWVQYLTGCSFIHIKCGVDAHLI